MDNIEQQDQTENETLEQVLARAKGENIESNLLKFSKTYRPFHYPWAFELAREHENKHWVEDEAELGDDVSQWKDGTINPIEKEHITQILRLFTQGDVVVGQNYYDQFIPRFKNNEVRNMLGCFAAREAIHQRAYALLNDTLGMPEEEYSAFLDYKVMTEKVDFMMESDVSTHSGLALALAKSVFNEGLCLFASFVMLLNYQRFGKMRGMCKITEWSLRDETDHVRGITRLFKEFCAEHPRIVTDELKKSIYEMARQFVKLEDRFIDLAYKLGEPEGLTAADVKKYIRYIADRRLIQLGLRGNWKVKENPLEWLGWITGDRQTNFFEGRVTDYDVSSFTGEWY